MKTTIKGIAKSLLFFILWGLGVGLIPIPDYSDPAIWRLFAEMIPLLITIVLTYGFVYFDKQDIKLGLKDHLLKKIFLGIIFGLIWLGLTIFIIYILGGLSIDSKNSVDGLFIWFIALFLNTIMQELVFRGYIYQMLKKDNRIVAVVVSTLLFTLLHGGAFEAGLIPVLNVITMSLFMTAVLEYADSLWPAIIIHYIWNAIGALVLGLVLLADDYINIYNMNFHGNELITGGAVKIEGSIIVLVLNLLLMIYFIQLKAKKKEHKEKRKSV
ncbi:MAG: type II CAAX endopeptidase family protein [Tissierellia bacterium]|nr:type II CAAX endopeptidase family protein [Tissierellia bacterium]